MFFHAYVSSFSNKNAILINFIAPQGAVKSIVVTHTHTQRIDVPVLHNNLLDAPLDITLAESLYRQIFWNLRGIVNEMCTKMNGVRMQINESTKTVEVKDLVAVSFLKRVWLSSHRFMSLWGKGSTLGAWKFSKLLGSKFTLVFLVLQPRSDTIEGYNPLVGAAGTSATSIGFLSWF